MKNAFAKLLCIILVVCMLVTATACNGKGNSASSATTEAGSSLKGTYVLTEAEYNGTVLTSGQLFLAGLMPTEWYLIFNGDGTGEVCLEGDLADIEYNATSFWQTSNSDDIIAYTLEGERISFVIDDVKLYFTPSELPTIDGDIYYFVSMEADGEVSTLEDLMAIGITKSDMYVQLNNDGTGILCLMGQTSDIQWEGTKLWPSGNEASALDFQLDGDQLILEQDGSKMIFQK